MASHIKTVTFRGGVHPPHSKGQTETLPIEVLSPSAKVYIPVSQHIGAPAKVIVKRGDSVKVGQVIAESGGFVSAPVHASVSGTVSAVVQYPHPLGKSVLNIEIENDGKDESVEFVSTENWQTLESSELMKKISDAGIVGMGGASFPTHVKLSPPKDKTIDTLIINGAECEPYLTADHRVMLEKTKEFLTGVLILKKILNVDNAYVGVEANKPDAINAIQEVLKDSEFSSITLVRLKTKYPQGGEKQLINAITKRAVPSGGLPMDCGCVVQNVGTAHAVWNAVVNGIPLYQRVVTVTGPAVNKPANLLIRIGTPFVDVLEYCDTDFSSIQKLIMGGPMMGLAQTDINAPVIKSTSGLLAYDKVEVAVRQHDCINCGNCVKACPIHLVPSFFAKYVEKGQYENAEERNIMDCMECGSCSFVCPSKINLVHFIKLGKFHVISARKAANAK